VLIDTFVSGEPETLLVTCRVRKRL